MIDPERFAEINGLDIVYTVEFDRFTVPLDADAARSLLSHWRETARAVGRSVYLYPFGLLRLRLPDRTIEAAWIDSTRFQLDGRDLIDVEPDLYAATMAVLAERLGWPADPLIDNERPAAPQEP